MNDALMQPLPLKDGTRVEIRKSSGYLSFAPLFGTVRGIATIFQPVLGRLVIVETDQPYTDWTCIAVSECHLQIVTDDD